jgi:hypothetical protein
MGIIDKPPVPSSQPPAPSDELSGRANYEAFCNALPSAYLPAGGSVPWEKQPVIVRQAYIAGAKAARVI